MAVRMSARLFFVHAQVYVRYKRRVLAASRSARTCKVANLDGGASPELHAMGRKTSIRPSDARHREMFCFDCSWVPLGPARRHASCCFGALETIPCMRSSVIHVAAVSRELRGDAV